MLFAHMEYTHVWFVESLLSNCVFSFCAQRAASAHGKKYMESANCMHVYVCVCVCVWVYGCRSVRFYWNVHKIFIDQVVGLPLSKGCFSLADAFHEFQLACCCVQASTHHETYALEREHLTAEALSSGLPIIHICSYIWIDALWHRRNEGKTTHFQFSVSFVWDGKIKACAANLCACFYSCSITIQFKLEWKFGGVQGDCYVIKINQMFINANSQLT